VRSSVYTAEGFSREVTCTTMPQPLIVRQRQHAARSATPPPRAQPRAQVMPPRRHLLRMLPPSVIASFASRITVQAQPRKAQRRKQCAAAFKRRHALRSPGAAAPHARCAAMLPPGVREKALVCLILRNACSPRIENGTDDETGIQRPPYERQRKRPSKCRSGACHAAAVLFQEQRHCHATTPLFPKRIRHTSPRLACAAASCPSSFRPTSP